MNKKILLSVLGLVLLYFFYGASLSCPQEEKAAAPEEKEIKTTDEVKVDEDGFRAERVKSYLEKARASYKNENYKLAVLESYKALVEDPTNSEAQGLIAMSEGKARKAAEKE